MTKKKTHEQFVQEFYAVCDSIEVLGEYQTTSTPIKCRCKICNHIWFPTPGKLLHGRRCPVCANEKRGIHTSREEFINKLGKSNVLVELVGDFKDGHTKTSFRCVKCGTIWEASPYSLLAGHGCPLCAHTGTSFSEQFIANALVYALGEENVLTRNRKLIGKELDIILPLQNIAIEYNGWFWHKNKLESDRVKAELCKQANFRLISIYDACPKNELPLNNDYITFEKDLALEPGFTTLKTLVDWLLKNYLHCKKSISESDWEQIIQLSMLNARKKSTEEFKKEFYSLCDTIEILGEYRKSSIPIECKCKICGYEWSVTPNGLLRGSRCANCSGIKRLTHNEFIERLLQNNESYRNGEIKILDKYISSSQKVTVKCLLCNRIWKSNPQDLMAGHSCGCNRGSINRYIKGTNDFETCCSDACLDWDYSKNKKLPSEYTKTSRDIVFWKCHVCGHEWTSSILTRARDKGKCKECKKRNCGRRVISEEELENRRCQLVQKRGSLLQKDPVVASYWHPTKNGRLTPNEVTVSSGKKVWWICNKGHEWQATIANMKYKPYCSVCNNNGITRLVIPGVNDLVTKNPMLMKEWDFENNSIDPVTISPGSHKKAFWKCNTCGHRWEAVISDRNRGHGCPECARRDISKRVSEYHKRKKNN